MLKIFTLSVLVFIVDATQAQDFRREFKQAKDHFEDGEYSLAMDSFKPLMVYDQTNPYPEYASFYYALSAQRLGYTSVAKETFLQMKKLYPDWKQLPEVNFWLFKMYFDQGEYFQGLLIAGQISDPELQSSISEVKRAYFPKIDDSETLKMILEDYPHDREAARALVQVLGRQPAHLQETRLIDSLCNHYAFQREQLVTVVAPKPVFKDTYRVALMMPFLASTLEPSPVKKRNQFVLDLYYGMKLAVDTLAKQGVNLELLAYDNERNLDATKKLLQKEELKTADVIVGPLFSEESVPVQQFANENAINLVINPLSNNAEFANNLFTMLYQPSHETLGIRSAEWVASKVKRNTCMVYYGETVKDSVMAFSFIKRALELGVNVVYAEEVRKETTGSILTKLTKATEFDEWKNPTQFELKRDSIGSIFVASNNELIYSKVINSVEARNDSIIVVGNESWIQETSVDYTKFERTHVVMTAPNYISMATPAYSEFRKRYIQKHGSLPVEYAAIGYEFIITLGQMTSQYGSNFLITMPEGTQVPGSLTQGYFFQAGHDNGKFPFITFQNGRLITVE